MHKTLGLIILIAVLIVVLFGVSYLMPKDTNQNTLEQKTYVNTDQDITFSYPAGYFISEREVGNAERGHYAIVLIPDTEENRAIVAGESAPRELPATIAIDIFRLVENESNDPEVWVRNTNESNFKLSSDGVLKSTVAAGLPAISYSYDGLYRTDATVLPTNNRMYVITGSYLDATDQIRSDYHSILTSMRLPLASATEGD